MPHETHQVTRMDALVENREQKMQTQAGANNSSRHRGPESEDAVKSAFWVQKRLCRPRWETEQVSPDLK